MTQELFTNRPYDDEYTRAHRTIKRAAIPIGLAVLAGISFKAGQEAKDSRPQGMCETTITKEDIGGSNSVARRLARPNADINPIIAGANDALAEKGYGSRNAQPGVKIVIRATSAVAPEKCDRYTSLDAE